MPRKFANILLSGVFAAAPFAAAMTGYGTPTSVNSVKTELHRLKTTTGQQYTIAEYEVPTQHAVPHIIAIDKADTIWFSESGGRFAKNFIDVPAQSKIGRIDQGGTISEWHLGDEGSSPMGVEFDKEGNLWITERLANRITRLGPNGQKEHFPLLTAGAWPTGMAIDRNGDVWFTETKADKIGVVRRANGKVEEFALPAKATMSTGIAAAPDGHIWIAERDINTIGRFDPKTREFTQYKLPTPQAKPCGVTVTAGGEVWFSERGGGKLGRIMPDGTIQEYALDDMQAGPFLLAADQFGDIWFTELFSNRIGRFYPKTGKFDHYPLPKPYAHPAGIAIDSKGNVWFAEQSTNKIATIIRADLAYVGNDARGEGYRGAASGGKHYEYKPFDIPTKDTIPGIVALDRKGVVWFTEMGGGFVSPGFPPGPPGSKVGYIKDGVVGEVAMHTPESGPTSMGLDPDNDDVWVTLRAANKIARIRGFEVTEYDLPLPNALPVGIAVDHGHNVWVALSDGNALARMSAQGQWRVLPIPEANAAPRTVLVDSKNEVWFAEKMGNHIGWVDQRNWQVQRWKIPTRLAWPLSLIEDDQGNLWFAEMRADKLGMLDRKTRQIHEYRMPVNSAPFKLYYDSADRSMWISTVFGNSVMRFDTTQGKVTDVFPVPNDGVWIGGIDRDNDRCFWVTEQFGNRLDRLCVQGYSKSAAMQPTGTKSGT